MQGRLFYAKPDHHYEDAHIQGRIGFTKHPPQLQIVDEATSETLFVQMFPLEFRQHFKADEKGFLFFDGVSECYALQMIESHDAQIIADSFNSFYELFVDDSSPQVEAPKPPEHK